METRAPWGAPRPWINGWPASPPRSPWPSTARDLFCCFHAGRGCADGATPCQGPWAVTGGVSRRGLDFGESIPCSAQPVPVLPNKGIPHQCPCPQGSRTHKLCALPSAEPKPHCGDVRPQISAWHAQLQPCSVLATYHGAAASIPRCRVCPPAPLPGAFQEMLEMLKMLRNVPGSAPGRALGSSQAPAG